MPDTEPGATCPAFDEAIAQIEGARTANMEMRSIVDQWREQAEYWETIADDFKEERDELEEERDNLYDEVRELRKQLDNLATY